MALDEESAESSSAEIGKPEAEFSAGNDAPVPGKEPRKQAGNGKRKSAGTEPGNAENVIKFRRPPTREEISALKEEGKSFDQIAEIFNYKSGKQMRNIFNGKSGLGTRQAAA